MPVSTSFVQPAGRNYNKPAQSSTYIDSKAKAQLGALRSVSTDQCTPSFPEHLACSSHDLENSFLHLRCKAIGSRDDGLHR